MPTPFPLLVRRFVQVLLPFFLVTGFYALGQHPSRCVRPPSVENQIRAHPSAALYAKSGTWFEQHDQVQCALRDYREATVLAPHSAQAYLSLGRTLLAANELQQAEAALRRSLALAPDLIEAHENLALALERLQKKDAAKQEWAAALKLNPASVVALDGMAKHLLAEGNTSAAIILLRSAPKDDNLTIDLAYAYDQAGSLADAETLLRKAVGENPASFPLTRALVGVLVDEHTFERTFQEPAQLAQGYAAAHPENVEAQRLYLQILLAWIPSGAQTGDVARATPLARRLLAEHPNDAYFLYANGMLERQAGDYRAAKEHLEKSLRLDPSSAPAHYELGMALAALNDAAGAKREFLKSLDLGNNDPGVRFQLAKVLRVLGETEEAQKQLKLYSDEMAFASQERVARLKEGQGDQALSSGNASEAATYFRQAIEANPKSAMLNFKLGMAFDKAGDLAGEKAALEKAVQIDPTLAIAQNQLGYLASREGDTASAEDHFRRAVQAAPAYVEAWVNLAATLGMESKIPEAQQAIAEALKEDPKNATALQLQQDLKAAQR